jgi:hypothetical protein
VTAAATAPGVLPAAGPGLVDELERLVSLLHPAFLQAIGWDAAAQAFTPPPEHPQLGRPVCLVAGCEVGSAFRNGLCHACRDRYHSSGLDLDAFITIRRVRVRIQTRGSSMLTCAVAGCPRPVRNAPAKLCTSHDDQRDRLGLSLAAVLTHPKVRALPSFGECRVAACTGPAGNRRRLCRIHDARWRSHQRRNPDLDFDRWCQTQHSPRNDAARVVLRGLPLRVQTELLYGLQERCRLGYKTKLETLRTLCDLLRRDEVRSVSQLAIPSLPSSRQARSRRPRRQACHVLAAEMQTAVKRAFSSPELERRKDVWDMAVFGHSGTLDFTTITQPWLRQAAKEWVSEDAPKRTDQPAPARPAPSARAAARRSGEARRPPTTATDAAGPGGTCPATNSHAHGGSGGVAASGQPGSPGRSRRAPIVSSRAATAPGSGLSGRSSSAGSAPPASRAAVTAGSGAGVAANASMTARAGVPGTHQPGRLPPRGRGLPAPPDPGGGRPVMRRRAHR